MRREGRERGEGRKRKGVYGKEERNRERWRRRRKRMER